jgi:hypothetical protein
MSACSSSCRNERARDQESLNFVNNFSAVSVNLIDEMRETLEGLQMDEDKRTAPGNVEIGGAALLALRWNQHPEPTGLSNEARASTPAGVSTMASASRIPSGSLT